MPTRRLAAVLAAAAVLASAAPGQEVKSVSKKFTTVDGVELSGWFYPSLNTKQTPKDTPVVVLLHAFRAKPDDPVWEDTAKTLAKEFNVFRFDFRGHGESTKIDPGKFYDRQTAWGQINERMVRPKAPLTVATKTTIKADELSPQYYPMLAQDLMAVRTELDRMNDNNEVNASSIYFVGAGDAAYLGVFFIAAEWQREKKKPDIFTLGQVSPVVSPGRPVARGVDVAGEDYGGAIWLGPARPPAGGGLTDQLIQKWVLSPYALDIRVKTPMAFYYGDADTAAAAVSRTLIDGVLKPTATTFNGQPLLKPDIVPISLAIKDTKLQGAKLLGSGLPTAGEAGYVVKNLTEADTKLRKGKTRQERKWDTPPYVDLVGFGVLR